MATACDISMKRLVAEALEEQVREYGATNRGALDDPPWIEGFGELAHLANENRKILQLIEEKIETILPNEIP